jgi:hypothetical protein
MGVAGQHHTPVVLPLGKTRYLLQPHYDYIYIHIQTYIQGDQEVSVHLMITIQKVTSNVQIYRHLLTRRTHTNVICYL